MREAVDLSLTTTPSKLLGKRDREKDKNKKAKKQRGNYLVEEAKQMYGKFPILSLLVASAPHKFLPALTMPYGEIGDDFGSLDDCDAGASSDIHLSSSSSFSSCSSSSLFSAAGVEVGSCTDDPSAKMEKDPRKIARRFDLFFNFSYLCVHLSELAFSSVLFAYAILYG